MPAIRVSKEVAGRLCALLNRRDAGSEPSLATLKGELDQPPRPTVKEAHYAGGTVLTHTCLIDVARWANKEGVGQAQQYSLESLLRGAEVAIPIKPKPERSPALIEALRKIELEQQQKEYDAMLPSHDVRQRPLLDTLRGASKGGQRMPGQKLSTEEQEWLEIRQQLSAIVNILVSVVAVAFAVWWAGGTADPIWKTLVAIPLSILVAIAEAALYARHWSNLRKRREGAAKGR